MTPIAPEVTPQKPTLAFTCHICGDGSERICVWCTKDCCDLHRCEKCSRCSDCCVCEVRDPRR